MSLVAEDAGTLLMIAVVFAPIAVKQKNALAV